MCVTSTQSFTLTLASEFGLSLAPFNEGNLDHAFSLGGRGGLTTTLEKEILEKYRVAKREILGDPLVIMVRTDMRCLLFQCRNGYKVRSVR